MNNRPVKKERLFESPIIEQAINRVAGHIRDAKLARLFVNCFPNTLDTTVYIGADAAGAPDTVVITGDIEAMWLRDSTNQVWPYLQFIRDDAPLRNLIKGVVKRQTRCVLIDPYANAFNRGASVSQWTSDLTRMLPDLHERKYELDSLCSVIRLSYGYYQSCGDSSCFDRQWHDAMRSIVATIRREQAGTSEIDDSAYRFQRISPKPSESLAGNGYGQAALRCGLSKSPFRPSDDAALLPFLVPANAMAVVSLRQLAELWGASSGHAEDAADALILAEEIDRAIRRHAIVPHARHGDILAYEIDGYGSYYCMDDANVPSLLSLPYLGYCKADDPLYIRTREFALSPSNPYFSEGTAGRGIGSPHTGHGTIWPIGIIMQALTSRSDEEIRCCLRILRDTDGGTGFMHESFWKGDPSSYSRSWFAWANTLFGELILQLDAASDILQTDLDARAMHRSAR